jgi:transcription elongation factor Elf1
MLLKQETVLCTLNRLFNQSAKIRKGTDAVYFCPICNHYKRKLEVNLNTGRYHCWVCDFSGLSLRSLFKKLKAPKDYYLILGEVDQMQSSERSFDNLFEIKNNNEKLNLLPEEFKPFSVPVKSYDFNRGLKYLLSRNITKYDILRYNIGYCDSGYYKNRIVIFFIFVVK